MTLTALEIKDKTFSVKFRGYSEEEVNEFLDIVVEDYEALVRKNHEQESQIKTLEEKLAYFNEMKESLSQSVILAQETAEKVKTSAHDEAANVVSKANFDSQHLIDEAKSRANDILREATDEAKRVAVETEELKRQTRIFHQRLIAEVEGQLGLANSPVWDELLKPTAVYLQNSDVAFKEVVEKVLDEHIETEDDSASFDATRQFTPEEMEELQRRVEVSNKQLEAAGVVESETIETSTATTVEPVLDFGETQTFKLNIED
ncbi:DivIVA domain-containing protein [Streptococcus sp. HF-1907]|uniref:DivIVA domain-containing protein n=1 Tax=Streptococcus sp. HF-1907 TaxID=2785793 RepID=UPI00189E75A6|nr:DivIVA domain-containing protein [Streptococcus sp. HF-1907]MBF7094585.1 DivIVA domain-containing protein [Streptococcus sp. HF-1907]